MNKLILTAAIASLLSSNVFAAGLTPLEATGWNQDIVVGVGEFPGTGTTKTMDGNGASQNLGDTWYGVGRNPDALSTGLPTGPTASESTPADLTFTLQSFTANNAIYNGGTLTLATPAPLARFALIGSTSRGPGNMTITVNFADSSTQVFENFSTGTGATAGINGDWFNLGPTAYTANGRITDSGGFNNVNAGNPRLYQSIFTLTNTTSNVNSITITDGGAGQNAIMAISGEVVPEPGTLGLLGVFGLGALGLAARRRLRA